MAQLFFRHGPMNSGKSILVQAAVFSYRERDLHAILAKPSVDTKSDKVSSRIGLETAVDWVIRPTTSFVELLETEQQARQVDCLFVDEAQFLETWQVDELSKIASLYGVPVIAYGLRTDFKTQAFPASKRFFEVAAKIEEIKTICSCGSKAIFNARFVEGEAAHEGDQIVIDTKEEGVVYKSLCPQCFHKQVVLAE